MTPEEIKEHKANIDAMSQLAMASLYRFAPAGHPYFVTGTELCDYFVARFKGFATGISKELGWEG